MVLFVVAIVVFILFIAVIGFRHNQVDWGKMWMNCLDGWMRFYCYRYHRLQASACRLPESGAALLVSNHVSGLDPFLLLSASKRPLRFLMAIEEYNRFGMRWLFRAVGCVPVERDTRPELAFRQAIRLLKNGEVVAIFPHGKIHLDSDPRKPLKKGAAKLAQLTDTPIISARIDGVKGQGEVVEAVLARSNAMVSTFPAIAPDKLDEDEIMTEIETLITQPQNT